jgi:hypothetical protein
MSIVFNAKDHSYKSNDGSEINWISVTTLVSHFKKPLMLRRLQKRFVRIRDQSGMVLIQRI